jgi:CTP:phosphocholine cytidylyltransferase-like protein/thiamine kinase-like enzyme
MPHKVNNAIILAAKFGAPFIPISFEIPRGLIPVYGQPIIERQIEQLQEAGVSKIIIVTGNMSEKFAYLKKKYRGIHFIYNRHYALTNNLSGLYRARRFLRNTYIVNADYWMRENIFRAEEEQSWCSAVYTPENTPERSVEVDASGRVTGFCAGKSDSWIFRGPVFVDEKTSFILKNMISQYHHTKGNEDCAWEDVLTEEIKHFDIYVRKIESDCVYKFETLEELRDFDPDWGYHTKNKCLALISGILNTEEKNIHNIKMIKTGMTNNSFSFTCGKDAYIFRNPGEGSSVLTDRKCEKMVYDAINDLKDTDDIIYFDEKTGVKISVYYTGANNSDPRNKKDILDSLMIIRKIHHGDLKTPHQFSIGEKMRIYLRLLAQKNIFLFFSYGKLYLKMLRLINTLKKMNLPQTFCHVDCNPDNFIRLEDGSLKIIDWEYAGMCDPILDISMYAIYSYYSKEEAEEFLNLYLEREPSVAEKVRLYAYMALGGFLWLLWTEYKKYFGVEFGDYAEKMKDYAKSYYKWAVAIINRVV